MKRKMHLIGFGIVIAIVSLTFRPKALNASTQSLNLVVSSPLKTTTELGMKKLVQAFVKTVDRRD